MAAHWQLRSNGFINCDDPLYVLNNSHVNKGLRLDEIRYALFTTFTGYWHPLTWLSHMLDVELFGLNPAGHHLTSLIWHTINTVVLFYLLTRLQLGVYESAFAAALFALHPVNVESVAWVSERKNLLSTFFWFMGILAYLKYVEQPQVLRYLPVFGFMVLGLMSKPMVVTFPLTLLILDFYPLKRVSKRVFAEKIPLFVLTLIFSVFTVYVQRTDYAPGPLSSLPITKRLVTAATSYLDYLIMTFWPFNLAMPYPYPEVVPLWKIAVSVAVLFVITSTAYKYRTARPYIAAGWLWFTVTLLPVMRLIQSGREAIADRYLYVPLVGLFVVIVCGVRDLADRYRAGRNVVLAVSLSVLVYLLSITWNQTALWKDSITLFGHTVKVVKDSYIGYNNYAAAYKEAGDSQRAVELLRLGFAVKPDSMELICTMGLTLKDMGKYEESIPYLKKCPPFMAGDGEAVLHKMMGMISFKQERYADAAANLALVISKHPGDIEAINVLGITLMKLNRNEDAITVFNRGLEIKQGNAGFHFNKGLALKTIHRLSEAVAEFSMALSLEPGSTLILNTLKSAESELSAIRNTEKPVESRFRGAYAPELVTKSTKLDK